MLGKNPLLRVIVGLGNPEDVYKGTRHNVGFETVNKLSFDYRVPVRTKRFRAHIGEGSINKTPVLLVKPQTYMNVSGESVRAVLQFYKIPPAALIVVYDDVNLPLGDIRVREKGSAGGHNGIKSLIQHLHTDEFPRIRVGVGKPGGKPPGPDMVDYVLGRFSPEEWPAMIEGVTMAGDAAALILAEGCAAAMNRYNKKIPVADKENT
jgi:PTH1 family peptidyl-tRNA hydrolase